MPFCILKVMLTPSDHVMRLDQVSSSEQAAPCSADYNDCDYAVLRFRPPAARLELGYVIRVRSEGA